MQEAVQGSTQALYPVNFEPVTHQDDSVENRQLFFAKVSKSAGEDEIKLLFSEYGTVQDVIIFQSSQGSATSKGCGLVTMGSHAEASAAIQGLHGKFAWSSRDPPMVVTWMDAALQDPARTHMNGQKGKIGGVGGGMGGGGGGDTLDGGADVPPAGCDPDAIKLFIGNIPLTYTEEQLIPLFQSIGTVVELVVVRNKQNSQSKGCAFVWYATRAEAELAMQHLNLKHMLPDVTGQQHRPLVVRKARTGHMQNSLSKQPGAAAGSVEGGLDQLLNKSTLGARLFQQGTPLAAAVATGPGSGSPSLSNRSTLSNLPPGAPLTASSVRTTSPLVTGQVLASPPLSAPVLSANTAIGPSLSFRPQPSALSTGQLQNTSVAVCPPAHIPSSMATLSSIQSTGSQLEQLQSLAMHNVPSGLLSSSTGHIHHAAGLGGVISAPTGPYHVLIDGTQYDIQQLGLSRDAGMEQYVHMQGMQGVQAVQMSAQMPTQIPTQVPVPSHGSVIALDTLQLSVVNSHLYSIQAATGAQLMVSPGGPGTFNLLLSGAQTQVDNAQIMLASLLGPSPLSG